MEFGKLVHSAGRIVKDTLFPAHCFGCDLEGKFVCDSCYDTLDVSGVFCCPVCHADTRDGGSCISCRDKMAIDRHTAIIKFSEDTLIGDMLHSFKYQFAQDIIDIFDHMIRDFFIQNKIDVDMIIAVPLHRRRYVERGFNQSEIIAESVARQLQVPISHSLTRTRYTKQQARLKREDRLQNLNGAFVLDNAEYVKNMRILLVDDVFTTGSTLNECAKVLKETGAREVLSFSIARG